MALCCGTAEQGFSQVRQWYIRWIKVFLLPGGLWGWAACTSSPAMPWDVLSIPQCHQQPVWMSCCCFCAGLQPHSLSLHSFGSCLPIPCSVSLVAFFSQNRP